MPSLTYVYSDLTKQCRDCKEVKPAAAFGKHPQTRDRLQPYCNACIKVRRLASAAKPKLQLTHKKCRDCKLVKPVSSFHADNAARSGFRPYCKECMVLRAKERADSLVRTLVTHKTCSVCKREKPVDEFNRASITKDGYYSACRDCGKARVSQWSKDNRDRRKIHHRDRAISKMNANMRHWDPELFDLANLEAEDARRVRQELTGVEWHLHHVVPLRAKSVCGLHFPTNWAVIPGVDNLKAGNRFEVQ